MRLTVKRNRMPICGTMVFAVITFLYGFGSIPLCRAQGETPSFRVAARLVELTVIALDKNGNPWTDLNKEDFVILDNGKPRNISLFRFEGRRQAPAVQPSSQSSSAPSLVFTNRQEADAAEVRNITALVLDSINTDPRGQIFVKGQTGLLLRALAPETRVAIYQMGRELRVIHDFTDEMASLRAHLAEYHGEAQAQGLSSIEQAARETQALLDQIEASKNPYIGPVYRSVKQQEHTAIAGEINANAVVRGNRVDMTLAALATLGRRLKDIPGRKSLVWISSGIPSILPQVTTAVNGRPVSPVVGDNLIRSIRKTSEILAQSGVALYAVDAQGLTSPAESLAQLQDMPLPAGRYSELERAAAQNIDNRGAFTLMTSITGGRFIFGTNDLSAGVKKVSADLHGAYSLGFYPAEEPDNKWHTLKVTVRQPDVRLLHKEGYLFDEMPVQPQIWDEEAERKAMLSPFGSDAIRLSARCLPVVGAEAGTLLLTLQITADDLFWREESDRMMSTVDVYIGEKTAGGNIHFQESRINAKFLLAQMATIRNQGLPFRRQWKIGPDTLLIRALVRDPQTGKLGTVDIPKTALEGDNSGKGAF